MFIKILKVLLIIYLMACVLLYFIQEKMIFFPEKLEKTYQFGFDQNFEEINIQTTGNIVLSGLLFKAGISKGLVFYLHGNAGSLKSWGEVAKTYTNLNYDIFMLDYRGYGKSGGTINSEEQLYKDIQTAYDSLKRKYDEREIIILGYSIGTGPAARLASDNHAKLLILQAPYYSLTDMVKHNYPMIPAFILKYKFETSKYIQACRMPVIIFHGDRDEVIYYRSSVKLKKLFKAADTLITLTGQQHNGITDNPQYLRAIQNILR